MIDRIFAPILTFAMLIGGTAAVASSLFAQAPAPAQQAPVIAKTVQPIYVLETVVITGKRQPA